MYTYTVYLDIRLPGKQKKTLEQKYKNILTMLCSF